ncbi:hypothetical protein E4U35_005927 [Claviceps purpurea]|nr:hypothetical protein E4U36_005942 [Claviceps purpurea]KAG6201121.1 hypothetical protein E4U35_005927 [Claviceps purpurea]
MAALIGDLVPDISRFHDMIASPSSRPSHRQQQQQQQQQQHHHHQQHKPPPQRQQSYFQSQSPHVPHAPLPNSLRAAAASTSQRDDIASSKGSRRASLGAASPTSRIVSDKTSQLEAAAATLNRSGVPLEFPSPAPSSSSASVAGRVSGAEDAKVASMASQTAAVVAASHHASDNVGRPQRSPPSSQSQSFHLSDSNVPSSTSSIRVDSPSSTLQSLQDPPQNVIHVRDLAHMQSLADLKMLGTNNASSLDAGTPVKYEISGMPIADVIKMVAALLTKITATNDLQHDAMQRNVAHQQQANQPNDSESGHSISPLSHSVLAFHGKNVPAITILSYLSRVHKYCPTTYEVFLSLLVYFDRMTERVNDMIVRDEQVRSNQLASQSQSVSPDASPDTSQKDTAMREPAHESDETDSDLADDDNDNDNDDDDKDNDDDANDNDDDDEDEEMADSTTATGGGDESDRVESATDGQSVALNPATFFVVDSFNIHRLIISGVTCASKFFSDVFYTNSRYAKVGGLPLAELNHLEIQFLVLNDFRLAIPVEDLEAYATMLVEFYAREVMSQASSPAA